MPEERAIATFRRYEDAQRALDRLAADGFAVDRAAIVARGLRLVRDAPHRSAAAEVGRGAGVGALSGLLFGAALGLFGATEPLESSLALGLWGLVLGAVLGAALAAVARAAARGRGAPGPALHAERFELRVDAEAAEDAARRLARRR